MSKPKRANIKRWIGLLVILILILAILPWILSAPGIKSLQQRNNLPSQSKTSFEFDAINLETEALKDDKEVPVPLVANEDGEIHLEDITKNINRIKEAQKPKEHPKAKSVRKVSPKKIAKEPKRVPHSKPLPEGTYIRLAIFSSKRNAEKLQKLLKRDFSNLKSHREVIRRSRKARYSVLVGPLDSKEARMFKTAIDFKYELKSVIVSRK